MIKQTLSLSNSSKILKSWDLIIRTESWEYNEIEYTQDDGFWLCYSDFDRSLWIDVLKNNPKEKLFIEFRNQKFPILIQEDGIIKYYKSKTGWNNLDAESPNTWLFPGYLNPQETVVHYEHDLSKNDIPIGYTYEDELLVLIIKDNTETYRKEPFLIEEDNIEILKNQNIIVNSLYWIGEADEAEIFESL